MWKNGRRGLDGLDELSLCGKAVNIRAIFVANPETATVSGFR
jgi:hypothetical protein